MSLLDRVPAALAVLRGAEPPAPDTPGGQLMTGVLHSGGEPAQRSAADYEKAYASMPWLRAVTARIAYDVAATDWKLLRPSRGRRRSVQRAHGHERRRLIGKMLADDELTEIPDHPILDLLHDANSVHTGLQLRELWQTHIELLGETFSIIERNRLNKPMALWPVPPSWVKSTPTPKKPFFEVRYRGVDAKVPSTEMLWWCRTNPANPYGRGTGIARALADELEADEYAAKMFKTAMFNRARPDIIISPKGDDVLDEPSVRRLETGWNNRLRGMWRAFKPFFTKRAIDVKTIDTSFQSLDFRNLREMERNTILQVFGVSPEILGVIAPGSSRATSTTAKRVYGEMVLVPRLEFLRSMMQERLVSEFDDPTLVVDYAPPSVEDEEMQLQAAKAMPGALTVDEWRGKMGADALPDDGGQVHLVRSNITAYEDLSDVSAMAPGGGDEGRRETDRSVAHSGGKTVTKAEESDDPLFRLGIRMSPAYARDLEGAWGDLGADVDALARALATGDLDAAISAFGGIARISSPIETTAIEHGKEGFVAGAKNGADIPVIDIDEIGIDFTLNQEATKWAEANAATMVARVGDDTISALQNMIALANEQGIPPAKLARMIVDQDMIGLLPRQVEAIANFRASLAGLSEAVIERRTNAFIRKQLRSRAETIARTEIMNALNQGQQELWQAAKRRGVFPSGTRRKWILSPDPCEVCIGIAGAEGRDGVRGEVRLDEAFAGGVMAPPAHPNCLPGHSLVLPGSGITAATKRWFDGEVVVISVAESLELTCTPNHPILTPSGWVPAGSLDVGGYVVADRRREWRGPPNGDDENVPASIEKVAGSFLESCEVSAVPVPVSAPDFHGDGAGSQVAIVGSDSLSGHGLDATLLKHGGKPNLIAALRPPLPLPASRHAAERVKAFLPPAHRAMGGSHLAGSLATGHLRPLEFLGLGLGASGDTALTQPPIDDGAADSELARKLIDGGSGPVRFDKVIDVQRYPFHGFVFNLEVEDGWYAANGIITHNCRCSTGISFVPE